MADSSAVQHLIAAAASGISQEFRQDPEFALRVVREPLTLEGWVGSAEGGAQLWMKFPVDQARLAAGQADAIAREFVAALREHRAAHSVKDRSRPRS
jgi:hypothetical protein